MRHSRNKIFGLFAGLVFTMISHPGLAAVNLTLGAGLTPQNVNVPINAPTISAGADIPVGSVIYQASLIMTDSFIEGKWPAADVGKTNYYTMTTVLINAPYPLADLASGPFAGGVYQTGIPGIGVAIIYTNGRLITTAKRYVENQNVLGSELGIRYNMSGEASARYVVLIKTGPITPGSYNISAANFPTVQSAMDFTQTNNANAAAVTGLPIKYWTFGFQGSLTVTSQTCTTPDVNVPMGSYEIHEYFTALNSVTPWVDASIDLKNCPTFHGFYNQTNAPLLMNYNTGATTTTTSINNSIGLRLTPTSSVIDAANGVMDIDTSASGAASGVGIQIGWGSSSAMPTPFDFAAEKLVTLPKDGSQTLRIPLAARYIQTAERPKPGKANGKVTFTINYY
jgi:type 1 fimbria pilin